jgi:hypothetical protein
MMDGYKRQHDTKVKHQPFSFVVRLKIVVTCVCLMMG